MTNNQNKICPLSSIGIIQDLDHVCKKQTAYKKIQRTVTVDDTRREHIDVVKKEMKPLTTDGVCKQKEEEKSPYIRCQSSLFLFVFLPVIRQ